MVNGVKNYLSSYSGSVKTSGITSSDFYDKSKCIKYWASHGLNSCRLYGDNMTSFTYNSFSWANSNLEFAFLAACHQLDGNGSNPRAKFANAMVGSQGVRAVCGYHEYAPAAGPNADAAVARYFLNYAKTGESVKSSWILANTDYGNLDYCVLTHSGNAQYSRFEGFPGLTYTRPGSSSTTILRFSSANPGGITQPRSTGTTFDIHNDNIQSNITLPNYSLQAIPIDITIKDNVDTTVLSNDSGLKTLNGEIKDTEIALSDEDAENEAVEWLNSIYNGINADDFLNRDIIINEIVVAEVDLDGDVTKEDEKTIAYNVRYNNKFNEIPIKGDHFNAIIDDTGVISSSVKHNNYQIVPSVSRMSAISSNDAKAILSTEFENNDALTNLDTTVVNVSVAFCDEDNDGVFDPSYVFEMTDGNTYTINSLNGTISY